MSPGINPSQGMSAQHPRRRRMGLIDGAMLQSQLAAHAKAAACVYVSQLELRAGADEAR